MRLSTAQRERLQEIAREAREIIGGIDHADGRAMTFAEIGWGMFSSAARLTTPHRPTKA